MEGRARREWLDQRDPNGPDESPPVPCARMPSSCAARRAAASSESSHAFGRSRATSSASRSPGSSENAWARVTNDETSGSGPDSTRVRAITACDTAEGR